jgi:hypothetical protein
MHSAIGELRVELKQDAAETRQAMWSLERTLFRASVGVIGCLIGVIGAILIKGG